ncbi:MAG: NAD(P)H-dependent glycerol-3-phosphate dehydrogenase [Candidatus Symbiodolus clandestinus]
MLDRDATMVILGAGSYGTALAVTLARYQHPIVLWGHQPNHMATLQRQRCNERYLPGIPFPESLRIEADLAKALASGRDKLLAVPSAVFGLLLQQLVPYWHASYRLAWVTKGLEVESGRLLQEVIRDNLGTQVPMAALAGPSFARELAAGLPTAFTLAASAAAFDQAFADDLQRLLQSNPSLRIFRSQDLISIQLGGGVKNVVAIAAGISDGIGYGMNARAALITCGLAEMTRLGVALGSCAHSFVDMATLGDMVLTCTDDQSRNRRFGKLLGQGKSIEDAQKEIGQVVEGFGNTKEVYLLARQHRVAMPITEQLYGVLYQGTEIHAATAKLLGQRIESGNQ